MKWRITFLLLGLLLVLSLMSCGTTQRWLVPVTETLVPAGVFRLPAEKSEKFVVLTIDDAPSSRTNEIVALLARHDASATFFVHTGQITDENRPYLEEAIAAGHELANHLPYDVKAWQLGRDKFEQAFDEADGALASFGDAAKPYFRPPRAYFRPKRMDPILTARGYDQPLAAVDSKRRYILGSFLPWDADGNKTNDPDAPEKNAQLARRYADQLADNLYPGAIVVFHDGEEGDGPDSDVPDRKARLAATFVSLESFLQQAHAKGYDVVSLSEGIARLSRPE